MPPKSTRTKKNKKKAASSLSSPKPKRAKNAAGGSRSEQAQVTKGRVLMISFDSKQGSGRERVDLQLGTALQGECEYGNTKVAWLILREGESAPPQHQASDGLEIKGLDVDDDSPNGSNSGSGGAATTNTTNTASNTSTTRLLLTYRSLQDNGKAIPAPKPDSTEQRALMQARATQAIIGHGERIQQLETAIESNHRAFERLTSGEDPSDDDLMTVVKERIYLRKQLKVFQAEDAEVCFELQGEEWSFEVEMGQHALLDGLPGRPTVVWLMAASEVLGSVQPWTTTHKVQVKGRL
jgi:hypothetical protein